MSWWRKWRKKPMAQAAPAGVLPAPEASVPEDERKEEPTGLHEVTVLTIQKMRTPLSELIAQLQEAKEQAQELVNTLDVPKVRTSSDPPDDEIGEEEKTK